MPAITDRDLQLIISHRKAGAESLNQKRAVERFFSQHAVDYSKSPSHASGSDLTALLKALRPKKSEVALDVATGTGFTAVALARLVGHVTGIDVTDGMLGQARMLATKEDVPNVRFELGDAMKIDYPGSTFDIVTTRRAAHHFENVPRFLREAKRVLRPGGRLGIVDMSPPQRAEVFSNKIERLRDKSHTEAFTPSAWKSMVSRAGFHNLSSDVLGEAVTFQRWLYPVEPGGPEEKTIRSAWGSASPRVMTLLEAKFEGDDVRGWTKNRLVLVASKAQ